MGSGWFDRTAPPLSTSLQGKQGMQGVFALVRGGSNTSNLLEPSQPLRFDVLEPPRTSAKTPCTLCFPCNDAGKEVGRTTLNSCDKPLHSLLSLYACVPRRFDEVRGA